MVICYSRVSSRKSNGKCRQSNASQKLALKSYCQNNGIRRPTYIEDHQSARGRTEDRPGFKQVMEACRNGTCTRLICWKMDRIARNAVSCMTTIGELMELGVRLDILTQNITFDNSPYSKFLIGLFSILSQMGSDETSERIKAGLRASNKTLGRPKNEKQRAKIKKWNDAGISVKEQAKRLKISLASVYAMRSRMELTRRSKR